MIKRQVIPTYGMWPSVSSLDHLFCSSLFSALPSPPVGLLFSTKFRILLIHNVLQLPVRILVVLNFDLDIQTIRIGATLLTMHVLPQRHPFSHGGKRISILGTRRAALDECFWD